MRPNEALDTMACIVIGGVIGAVIGWFGFKAINPHVTIPVQSKPVLVSPFDDSSEYVNVETIRRVSP